jgi:hypothetical protein
MMCGKILRRQLQRWNNVLRTWGSCQATIKYVISASFMCTMGYCPTCVSSTIRLPRSSKIWLRSSWNHRQVLHHHMRCRGSIWASTLTTQAGSEMCVLVVDALCVDVLVMCYVLELVCYVVSVVWSGMSYVVDVVWSGMSYVVDVVWSGMSYVCDQVLNILWSMKCAMSYVMYEHIVNLICVEWRWSVSNGLADFVVEWSWSEPIHAEHIVVDEVRYGTFSWNVTLLENVS